MPRSEQYEQIANTLKSIKANGGTAHCLALTPKPVIVIETERDEIDSAVDDAEFLGFCFANCLFDIPQRREERPTTDAFLFRCVTVERLPVILATGCDVEPSNAVLFAAQFGYKAKEYGGDSKVLLLFDGWAVEAAFRRVPRDIDATELGKLKQLYPYEHASDDDSLELWRIPQHNQMNPYYSKWIPGDPWQALLALFVIGPKSQSVNGAAQESMQKCSSVLWTREPRDEEAGPGMRRLCVALQEIFPRETKQV